MYYKQLDGLRAFAVIGVILHHWINPEFEYASWFHYGANGVVLFFVLSGFLITNILIHQKEEANFSLLNGLKTFYIRRSLRIFPIYYLVIILLIIIVPYAVNSYIPWLVTYQYNNHIFFNGWQAPSYIQHLWTLSIEEQFYLIWPIILFSFSIHRAKYFIIATLLLSMITIALLYKIDPNRSYGSFTLSSFSGLSIGSLLAFIRYNKQRIPFRKQLFIIILICIIYLYSPYLHFTGKSFLTVFIPTFALLSVLIIDKAIDGYKGIIGNILEAKPLVLIGKISYGLYLYHMFVPHISNYFLHDFNFSSEIYAIINTTLLIVISLISWFLIEKPINKLKNKFEY